MNLESKRIEGISKEIGKVIARETGKDYIMNRELARIIVCLMADKLDLPSMMLESLEENLVKGNFDKVLEYYNKRCREVAKKKLEKELKYIITMLMTGLLQENKIVLLQENKHKRSVIEEMKKPYKVVEEEMYFGTRYYIKHIKLDKPVGYPDACPYNRQFHIIYYYSKARADAECRYLNKNFPNN